MLQPVSRSDYSFRDVSDYLLLVGSILSGQSSSVLNSVHFQILSELEQYVSLFEWL